LVLLADITDSSARNPGTSRNILLQISTLLGAIPPPEFHSWDGYTDSEKCNITKFKLIYTQSRLLNRKKIGTKAKINSDISTKFTKLVHPYWPCIRPCRYRGPYWVIVNIVGSLRKVLYRVYCQGIQCPCEAYCRVTAYMDRFLERVQCTVYCQCFVLMKIGMFTCDFKGLQCYVMIANIFVSNSSYCYLTSPPNYGQFFVFHFILRRNNLNLMQGYAMILFIFVFIYSYCYLTNLRQYGHFSDVRFIVRPDFFYLSKPGYFQFFYKSSMVTKLSFTNHWDKLRTNLFIVSIVLIINLIFLCATLTTNFRRCFFKSVCRCLVTAFQGCSGGQRVLLSVDNLTVSTIFYSLKWQVH